MLVSLHRHFYPLTIFSWYSFSQADDGLGGLLLSDDGIDLTSAYLLESLG